MKTLGINIDFVLRDFATQFEKIYRKTYIHNPSLVDMQKIDNAYFPATESNIDQNSIESKESELISLPMTSANLLNHYKFDEKIIKFTGKEDVTFKDSINIQGADQSDLVITPIESLNNFMFEEFPFQIFGQAGEIKNAITVFNKIQQYGRVNKKFKTILFSNVQKKAITATYYFLGSNKCVARQLAFVEEHYEKWDMCDVLIDVYPEAFQYKPDGKISIKINQPFNQWDNADHQFTSLDEFHKSKLFETLF